MFEIEDWESSINQDREVSLVSALRSSVSFGRFVSESLDWGKWSSFHHNRYLEDAEKHSVRGSVAQKKAYFEAHYKKKLAKQVEDQANSNSQSDEENRNAQIEIDSLVQGSSADVISNLDDEQIWFWDGENLRIDSPVVSRSEFSPVQEVHDVQNREEVVEEEVGKIKLSDEPPLKEIPANNGNNIENVKKKAIVTSVVRRSSRLLPQAPQLDASPVQNTKENKLPSTHKISGERKKFVPREVHMRSDSNQPRNHVISPSLSKTSSVLEKVRVFTNLSRASQECSHPVRKPSSNAARDCSHKIKTPASTASKVHPYSLRSSVKGSLSGEKKIALEAATQNSGRIKTTRNRILLERRDQEANVPNADSKSLASRRMQTVSSNRSVLVDEKEEKPKQLGRGKDNMVLNMAKRLQSQAKEQAPLTTRRPPTLARKNKETTYPNCLVSSKYCGEKISGRPNRSPVSAVWK